MSAVAMRSFGFGEQLVRAVERDGLAWFVGNDVCAALQIGNARDALGRLEQDERDCVGITDAIGRDRETTIISESGVYALVFTSRKEAAKRFRRWVTQDVLPTLRATGSYAMPEADEATATMPDMPDEMEALRTKLAIAREARIVFGVRAARKAWRAMALLPELTERIEDDRLLLPSGVLATHHASVTDWIEARTVSAPGHRVETFRLYDDYLDWAKAEELASAAVVSMVSFGRALTLMGVDSVKSDRMHRVGLRLAG